MRVVQLLPMIAPGDAVGNDARALRELLKKWDSHTEIYAETIAPGLPAGTALDAKQLPALAREDVLIYHMSIGSPLARQIEGLRCRKLMIFHNVTPPEYFVRYSPYTAAMCQAGLEGLERMRGWFDYCLPVSDFNRQGLLRAGYTCPMDVCPLRISFADYERQPDEKAMEKYGDGRTNILFVGRVAPNKKQEDLIRAFACYQRRFDPEARLILAGGIGGMGAYRDQLLAYAQRLGARNVVQTGHIPFAELLALYRRASVFACLSEHEGFCVPLVEAMYFGVPIAAYAAAAVPETLGGSGVLLDTKDPERWARELHALVADPAHREEILAGQARRLADFAPAQVARRFTALLDGFLARAPRAEEGAVPAAPDAGAAQPEADGAQPWNTVSFSRLCGGAEAVDAFDLQEFNDWVMSANANWNIPYYRPLPGGALKDFAKRVVRKLSRFWAEPVTQDISAFHWIVTSMQNRLVGFISRQLLKNRELSDENRRLRQRLEAVETRLDALEKGEK